MVMDLLAKPLPKISGVELTAMEGVAVAVDPKLSQEGKGFGGVRLVEREIDVSMSEGGPMANEEGKVEGSIRGVALKEPAVAVTSDQVLPCTAGPGNQGGKPSPAVPLLRQKLPGRFLEVRHEANLLCREALGPAEVFLCLVARNLVDSAKLRLSRLRPFGKALLESLRPGRTGLPAPLERPGCLHATDRPFSGEALWP